MIDVVPWSRRKPSTCRALPYRFKLLLKNVGVSAISRSSVISSILPSIGGACWAATFNSDSWASCFPLCCTVDVSFVSLGTSNWICGTASQRSTQVQNTLDNGVGKLPCPDLREVKLLAASPSFSVLGCPVRRRAEFQWFLMLLSDLPGSCFAISAHELPSC